VLTGVTTNTITILHLKYTYRFALVVTAWVEVFASPTMKEATVEKGRLQGPVSQQLQKEQPHFVADRAAGVGQESLYHCCFNVKRRLRGSWWLRLLRFGQLLLFQLFFLHVLHRIHLLVFLFDFLNDFLLLRSDFGSLF
jgi:hypothetical protein